MRKRDRDRKYQAAVDAATVEDIDDALELIDRLTVPLRDRALLELAGGALLARRAQLTVPVDEPPG